MQKVGESEYGQVEFKYDMLIMLGSFLAALFAVKNACILTEVFIY